MNSSALLCRQAVRVLFRRISITPAVFCQYNNNYTTGTMGGDQSSSDNNSSSGTGNKETPRKDHMELTAEQQRDPSIHPVTVTEVRDISPTVKKVVVKTEIKPVPIQFKAGQWIDMLIPNVSIVGGYTITSSPIHLQRTGELELAIKLSDWPPAVWIHTECKVGSEVSLRTGGDFFFDSTTIGEVDRVLLLAGGVGINPLASIINQIQDERAEAPLSPRRLRTSLLFSAKLESELLFKERFESYAETDKDFKCSFFLTGEPKPSYDGTKTNTSTSTQTKAGRIGLKDLREALEKDLEVTGAEDRNKVHVYICGPPPMITDLERSLKELQITTNIFFEKWWQS